MRYPLGVAIAVALVWPPSESLAQGSYTLFTGPSAGTVLFSPNGVNVFQANASGNLVTGPECPPASLNFGNFTFGPSSLHFHGLLNGVDDGGVGCGHGHVAPGDYSGIFAANTVNGAVRTFVLPHVLEKNGSVTNTSFTFDTQVFATYAGEAANPPPGGSTVDVFMFDNLTGQPLKGSNNAAVCNPCALGIGSGSLPRKQTVNLDSQLTTVGGGFPWTVVLGFAIAVVNGDSNNVNITSAVTNSKTNPLDVAVFGFTPAELGAASPSAPPGAQPAPGLTTLRLDNLHETVGSTALLGGVTDTLIKGVYAGGLVDGATPQSVGVQLDLFDSSGATLTGSSGPVGPVLFTLDSADRVFSMTVEEIAAAAGGLAGPLNFGYAIATVSGDTDNFVLAGYHMQTGSSADDMVVFEQTLAQVPEPGCLWVGISAALVFSMRRVRFRQAA